MAAVLAKSGKKEKGFVANCDICLKEEKTVRSIEQRRGFEGTPGGEEEENSI